MPDGGDAILARSLVKRYDGRDVLKGVNLAVSRGEIFGVLGPNGSGKSTTIKILCGLVRPDGGEAYVGGVNLRTHAATARSRIGYMAQAFTLYPDLTGAENLEFYARAYLLAPQQRRTAVAAAVDRGGLQHALRKPARLLSGGWQRRLALACALLHDPPVVFLDEPTSGIDPAARAELWEQLRELAASGKTFFVTTHYLDEAKNCSRLAYLNDGELAAYP